MALALILRALPAVSSAVRSNFATRAAAYGIKLGDDVGTWAGKLTTAISRNKTLSVLLLSDLYDAANAVGEFLPFSADEIEESIKDFPDRIRAKTGLTPDDVKRIALVTGDQKADSISGTPASEAGRLVRETLNQRALIDRACRILGSPAMYHAVWMAFHTVDAEVHVDYMKELGVE